jgi:sulfate adenylyltransferase
LDCSRPTLILVDNDSPDPFLSFYSTGLFMAAKQVPHGGTLVDLVVKTEAEKEAAIAKATVTLQASERQLCDLELIMNGGFSPLTGFMDEATYNHVVENVALPDGTIFGLPVVFDTNDESLAPGTTILLKQGDLPIATVELTDKYAPNKAKECKKCYGTSELEHPGTLMVATERGMFYMGGTVTGLNYPIREFPCKTPAEVRAELPDDKDVVAFQCRNPVHRAHYELFTRALDDALVGKDGIVLVHPTCGPTQVRFFKLFFWRGKRIFLIRFQGLFSTLKFSHFPIIFFRPMTFPEMSVTRPMRS